MKKIAFLFLLPLFAQTLIAQDESKNFASSSELILQITSIPEAKFGFTQHFSFPFLQGRSPLTAGNNIGINLTGEVTPISINALADAIWTPIAFFELSAGGRIGSGWNIELFGSELNGIGINQADAEGKAEVDGSAFDGLLWKAQAGGALQFDLAAIFPGDWHHVVLRSYHEINYKGYTRASKNESWYFEGDGENCNGFNYYGNLLIGYQMPIFLNTVALLRKLICIYTTRQIVNNGVMILSAGLFQEF